MKRISGIQTDEGNARLQEPVTKPINLCVFRVANALALEFVEIAGTIAFIPAYPVHLP